MFLIIACLFTLYVSISYCSFTEKLGILSDNIKEWTGLDFASSTRAAEDRQLKMEMGCCEVIYGARTTRQGYEID